jgi:hypothetical protein
MSTKLSLPAGTEEIAKRLKLDGSFHIPAAHFTNEKVQNKIDSLSVRSRGSTRMEGRNDPVVTSDLEGTFSLNRGVLSFSRLNFMVPGTHANMTGQYSLDGNTFDFHGLLKLDARLSQMTTGWKSILLRPIDPFFRKDGAGTELPFRVSGTREAPRFGLDFHHKDDHSKGDRLFEEHGQAEIR